jgi:hypothetical protein
MVHLDAGRGAAAERLLGPVARHFGPANPFSAASSWVAISLASPFAPIAVDSPAFALVAQLDRAAAF